MASGNRSGKMVNYINYRMRAYMKDGRQMVGQMLAFDKHMNLVLADCEEFRKIKKRAPRGQKGESGAGSAMIETEEKRPLGLVIIRGAQIVSVAVESPPPADPSARLGAGGPSIPGAPTSSAGPGISRPAGRGAGTLQGPAPGVGGPGPGGMPPGMGRGGPPGFPGMPGPPNFFGGPPPGFPNFPPGMNPLGHFPPGQGRGGPPPGSSGGRSYRGGRGYRGRGRP